MTDGDRRFLVARSEPQGGYQRGVQTQEPRQERVFQTRSACRQESSGNRASVHAPSQVLAKHSVQIGCTETMFNHLNNELWNDIHASS